MLLNTLITFLKIRSVLKFMKQESAINIVIESAYPFPEIIITPSSENIIIKILNKVEI